MAKRIPLNTESGSEPTALGALSSPKAFQAAAPPQQAASAMGPVRPCAIGFCMDPYAFMMQRILQQQEQQQQMMKNTLMMGMVIPQGGFLPAAPAPVMAPQLRRIRSLRRAPLSGTSWQHEGSAPVQGLWGRQECRAKHHREMGSHYSYEYEHQSDDDAEVPAPGAGPAAGCRRGCGVGDRDDGSLVRL